MTHDAPPSFNAITGATQATTDSPGIIDDIVTRLSGHSEWLNELGGHAYRFNDFSDDPGLGYFPLTQPTGVESLTPSIASGKMRYTAPGTNTDANLRVALPDPAAGHMGNSEVRSIWYDSSQDLALSGAGGDRWQPGHVHRLTHDKQVLYRGSVDSALANTLVQTDFTWASSQFVGVAADAAEHYVTITAGTGLGQTRRIAGNAAGALIISPNWTTIPDATSNFQVWTQNNRAVTLTKNVFLNAHYLFNWHVWEGSAFFAVAAFLDFGTYLAPGGVIAQFPWQVWSKVEGRVASVAVAKGSDTPDYNAVGRSGSVTLPLNFCQSGESGLYLGHLNAADVFDFKDLLVVRL